MNRRQSVSYKMYERIGEGKGGKRFKFNHVEIRSAFEQLLTGTM